MVLIASLTMACCFSPAQDRERLKEVQRIWSTLPLYPGMVEVDSSTISGFGKAFISKSFRSRASYEDVKRFYVERMTQDGWRLARERRMKNWGNDLGGREIEFRRDNYQITIEYASESADYGWEYGIGVGWIHE